MLFILPTGISGGEPSGCELRPLIKASLRTLEATCAVFSTVANTGYGLGLECPTFEAPSFVVSAFWIRLVLASSFCYVAIGQLSALISAAVAVRCTLAFIGVMASRGEVHELVATSYRAFIFGGATLLLVDMLLIAALTRYAYEHAVAYRPRTFKTRSDGVVREMATGAGREAITCPTYVLGFADEHGVVIGYGCAVSYQKRRFIAVVHHVWEASMSVMTRQKDFPLFGSLLSKAKAFRKLGDTMHQYDLVLIEPHRNFFSQGGVTCVPAAEYIEGVTVTAFTESQSSEGNVVEHGVKDCLLWHTCSTTDGWSGSPLLQQQGNRVVMVAAHVGAYPRAGVNFAHTIMPFIGALMVNVTYRKVAGLGLEREVKVYRRDYQRGVMANDPILVWDVDQRNAGRGAAAYFEISSYPQQITGRTRDHGQLQALLLGADQVTWTEPTSSEERRGVVFYKPDLPRGKAPHCRTATPAQEEYGNAVGFHLPQRSCGEIEASLEAGMAQRGTFDKEMLQYVRAAGSAVYHEMLLGSPDVITMPLEEDWTATPEWRDRIVTRFNGKSRPGFPLEFALPTNAKAFESETLWRTAEAFVRAWRKGEAGPPVVYTLSVKQEPHPERKRGKPRLIWVPPLAVNVAAAVVRWPLHEWMVRSWERVPQSVGMGLDDPGLEALSRKGFGLCTLECPDLVSFDISGFDWNFGLELQEEATKVETKWFKAVDMDRTTTLRSMWRAMCTKCKFVMSSGKRGEVDRMWASGGEPTATKGSTGSSIAGAAAGRAHGMQNRVMSIGDDVVMSWNLDRVPVSELQVTLARMGLRVKFIHEHRAGQSFKFCSYTFDRSSGAYAYVRDDQEKALYNLLGYVGSDHAAEQLAVWYWERRHAPEQSMAADEEVLRRAGFETSDRSWTVLQSKTKRLRSLNHLRAASRSALLQSSRAQIPPGRTFTKKPAMAGKKVGNAKKKPQRPSAAHVQAMVQRAMARRGTALAPAVRLRPTPVKFTGDRHSCVMRDSSYVADMDLTVTGFRLVHDLANLPSLPELYKFTSRFARQYERWEPMSDLVVEFDGSAAATIAGMVWIVFVTDPLQPVEEGKPEVLVREHKVACRLNEKCKLVVPRSALYPQGKPYWLEPRSDPLMAIAGRVRIYVESDHVGSVGNVYATSTVRLMDATNPAPGFGEGTSAPSSRAVQAGLQYNPLTATPGATSEMRVTRQPGGMELYASPVQWGVDLQQAGAWTLRLGQFGQVDGTLVTQLIDFMTMHANYAGNRLISCVLDYVSTETATLATAASEAVLHILTDGPVKLWFNTYADGAGGAPYAVSQYFASLAVDYATYLSSAFYTGLPTPPAPWNRDSTLPVGTETWPFTAADKVPRAGPL
jgi:hypothetical protein